MDKQLKFDSIVICSTLNQMVNYIPIRLHGIDSREIYNIRMENSGNEFVNKKFNYDNWDKNLKTVLGVTVQTQEQKIVFTKNNISSHECIIKRLRQCSERKLKDNKVLWNITGGQRHFVMAITEFVFNERSNDTIMYYDGDNEKIYYYNKNERIPPKEILKQNVNLNISIPKALRLMGFHVKEKNDLDKPSEHYNSMESGKVKNSEKYKWYQKFYNLYCNENNKKLRQILINSNRFRNDKDDKKKVTRNVLDKIIEEIENSNLLSEVKEMFRNDNRRILESSILGYEKGKVFGYILEKMTLYNLIEVISKNPKIKNVIADIDADIKIDDGNSNSDKNLDQFDVMIATKTGKIIMFECKSGSMEGDAAKSNNYSTYAISGVYGTPIIVIPTINDDNIMDRILFQTTVTKVGSKESEPDLKENEDLYSQIRITYKSAERAFLSTCCISELESVIDKYIK